MYVWKGNWKIQRRFMTQSICFNCPKIKKLRLCPLRFSVLDLCTRHRSYAMLCVVCHRWKLIMQIIRFSPVLFMHNIG